MITKVEVNGFKSLRCFELKLANGLNVLVGPNGAGKTNIILFFELLSNIANFQIGTAVSQVGGAGSIFEKQGDDQYSDTINVKIYGCYAHLESDKKFITYEYSFDIKISFEKDTIFYINQEIKFRNSTKFWDDPDLSGYQDKWDLHVVSKIRDENKVDVSILSFDQKKIKFRFLSDKPKEFLSGAKDFITGQNPSYNSLIKCLLPIINISHPILLDLRGGETFNIVPSKVRELEDSATPPGIKKDGSGLATTLYAMKKSRVKQISRELRFWISFDETEKNYNPKTLDKIISFLKAANSSIQTLDVDNDPFNNKLRVKIKIRSGDYEATLPLSSMSDGTVKWLTLITAILTSKTIFSIEEPENFLHPWMQAEIAIIMRNHLQEKRAKAFVLMTTHSESLLNHTQPEEIIIVDLIDGKTVARRINNIQSIKDEISNSGLGLGHFYFSNALSDE